jgi:uncharacterized coiled-coil DUF342 family protein
VHAASKRAIIAKREQAENEINDLRKEIQRINKQCHPVYNTLDDLDKGQKILNRRLETTAGMSRQAENALIKEIEQIQKSAPLIKQK